jgi:hypothetical protein
MVRFWVIAALAAVTLAATACGGDPVGDGPRAEAAQGKEGSSATGTEPDDDLSGSRTELAQTQTAEGVRVALHWVFADEQSVEVSFTVEDLQRGRRLGGHPVELQPGYFAGMHLTDEGGTGFKLAHGGGETSPGPGNVLQGPLANTAVFEAQRSIEPDGEHRFRLEIPLYEVPVTSPGRGQEAPEAQRVGEPFVFGFEAPVHPAPVVEVNRKATASSITLTLERVTDSPGRPEAVLCLEARRDVRGWVPAGEDLALEAPDPAAGDGNCLQVMLSRPLDGPSSVTVQQIELNPANDGDVINGPWTFEFETPES